MDERFRQAMARTRPLRRRLARWSGGMFIAAALFEWIAGARRLSLSLIVLGVAVILALGMGDGESRDDRKSP